MKKQYGWQNFTIHLETNSNRVSDLIHRYTTLVEDATMRENQIELSVQDLHQGSITQSVPADAAIIAQGSVKLETVRAYTVYHKGESFWNRYEGYGSSTINLEERKIVVERVLSSIEFEYYSVFLLILKPLMDVLRSFDYHRFHTSCVEVNGHSILLSGESGGGKSTATFAFLAKGYPALSDEMPLIRFENGQYHAVSISDTVKICEDSRQRFFESFSKELPLESWRDEWYLQLREQGHSVQKMADIRHLFVLKKTGKSETRITAMHSAAAVSSLFPVTMKLGSGRETKAVFRFVMDFLNDISCYEVAFGTDMDLFVQAIEGVLDD